LQNRRAEIEKTLADAAAARDAAEARAKEYQEKLAKPLPRSSRSMPPSP